MKRRSFLSTLGGFLAGGLACPLMAVEPQAPSSHFYCWSKLYTSDPKGLPKGEGVQVLCNGVDCGRKVCCVLTGDSGVVCRYVFSGGRYQMTAGGVVVKELLRGHVALLVDGQVRSGVLGHADLRM